MLSVCAKGKQLLRYVLRQQTVYRDLQFQRRVEITSWWELRREENVWKLFDSLALNFQKKIQLCQRLFPPLRASYSLKKQEPRHNYITADRRDRAAVRMCGHSSIGVGY